MPNGFGNIFAIPQVDTRGIAASVPKYNPMSGLAALIQAQNAVMRQARAAGGGGAALGPGQYKGVGDPSKGKWAKIPGIAELQWIPGSSKEERAANEVEAINQARAAIIQSDTDLQNQLRGLSEKSVPAQQEVLAAVRTNGTIARMAPKLGLSEADTAKLLLDAPTQELAKRQKAIGDAGFFKQLKDMGAGIVDRFSATVEAFGKSAEEQAAIGRRLSQQEAQRVSENARADEFRRLEQEGRSTVGYWLSNPLDTAVMHAGPIAATVVPQLALGTAGMMVGGPVGGLAGAVLGGGLSSAAYGAGEMLQRAVNDPNLTPEQQAQAAHEGYYTGAGISGIVGAIPIGPAAIPGAIGRRLVAREAAKAGVLPYATTAEGKKATQAIVNELYARKQLERSAFSRYAGSMLGSGVDAATLGVAEQLGHNLAYNSASGQNTPATEGLFEQGLAGAVLGIPFGIRGGRASRWQKQISPRGTNTYNASTNISPEQMAEGNWMPPMATDAELAAVLGTSAPESVKPVTPKGAAKFNVSRASEIVNNTEARGLMPKVEAAIWRGDADAAAFEKVVRKLPEDDPKRLAVAKGIENAYIGRAPDITETPVPSREIPVTSQEGGAAVRMPTAAEQALSTSTKNNVSETVSNLYYSGTPLQDISEAARTTFRNSPDMRAEVEREIMRLTQNTPQYMPESGVKKMLGAAKKKAELQQALETELTRGNIDPAVLDNVMQGYSANSWRRQAIADALAIHRAAQANVPPAPQQRSAAPTPTANGADTIRIPNRAPEDFAYEIVDADAVQASHLPEAGFQRNPRYQFENERRYHDEPGSQAKVLNNAQALDPALLLDSVVPDNGAPIIDREGNVLGGNGRTMSVRAAYDKFPAQAQAYKNALVAKAASLGLDPARAAQMEKPLLVRRLARDMNLEERQALVSSLNDTFTDSKAPLAEGKSRGDRLSPKTLEALAHELEDADSLRDFFDKPTSAKIVDRLIKDGVLTPQDRNRLLGKDGLLNSDGKRAVEHALRGRAVSNYEALNSLSTPELSKIDAAIPHLLIAEGRGGDWNITRHLNDAINLMAEYRASGHKKPDTFMQQMDMRYMATPAERYSPAAQRLFHMILDSNKKDFVRAFAGYAGHAKASGGLGGTLSAEKAKQNYFGFKEASGGNRAADATGRVNEPASDMAADGQLRKGEADTTNPPVDSAEPVNTEAAAPAAADQPLAEARVRNPDAEGRRDAGAAPQDTGAPETVAAAPRGQESGGASAVDGERGGSAAASKRATADTGKRSVESEAGAGPSSRGNGADAGGAETVAKPVLTNGSEFQTWLESQPTSPELLKSLYPRKRLGDASYAATELMAKKALGEKLTPKDKERLATLKANGVPDMEVNVKAVDDAVAQSKAKRMPVSRLDWVMRDTLDSKRRTEDPDSVWC